MPREQDNAAKDPMGSGTAIFLKMKRINLFACLALLLVGCGKPPPNVL
ncbi:MAG: hypothetical protein GY953_35985 [bacterium]|nr:hypothetical protein [bacterium]